MSQAGQAAPKKTGLMLAREEALPFPFTRFSGSGEANVSPSRASMERFNLWTWESGFKK